MAAKRYRQNADGKMAGSVGGPGEQPPTAAPVSPTRTAAPTSVVSTTADTFERFQSATGSPSAPLGEDLANVDFDYIQDSDGDHNITAYLDGHGDIGALTWDQHDGHIYDVSVEDTFRRCGVATRLWREANRYAMENRIAFPQHSDQRSTLGEAWARAVGGDLPGNTADYLP